MMTLDTDLRRLADALVQHRWQCAVAESCTGGLVGATITQVPGASRWFAGGVISYANEVKTALLGVPEPIIETHGAVSEPVVRAMALGAARVTGAQAAVSISGVAGPDGGTAEKPVGTVWIGIAVDGTSRAVCHHYTGDRDEIRRQAVADAIALLADAVTAASV